MATTNVFQDIVRDLGQSDRAAELIEGRLLNARRAWQSGRTSRGVYDVACRQAARAWRDEQQREWATPAYDPVDAAEAADERRTGWGVR